mmetsp:Transcript_17390/g.52071  ORF Transcript_17390/g.52071 Transcript_17390/m.52071 type:complete len:297 (+) Transcript_17390:2356-3246(+)
MRLHSIRHPPAEWMRGPATDTRSRVCADKGSASSQATLACSLGSSCSDRSTMPVISSPAPSSSPATLSSPDTARRTKSPATVARSGDMTPASASCRVGHSSGAREALFATNVNSSSRHSSAVSEPSSGCTEEAAANTVARMSAASASGGSATEVGPKIAAGSQACTVAVVDAQASFSRSLRSPPLPSWLPSTEMRLLMARDSREPEELLRTGAEGLGSRAAAASGASPGARSMWCGSRPSLCRRVMQSRMSRQPARRLDPYLLATSNTALTALRAFSLSPNDTTALEGSEGFSSCV